MIRSVKILAHGVNNGSYLCVVIFYLIDGFTVVVHTYPVVCSELQAVSVLCSELLRVWLVGTTMLKQIAVINSV